MLLLMMSCIDALMHGGSNCLDYKELVQLWFCRALGGLLLSGLWVLGAKKGKALSELVCKGFGVSKLVPIRDLVY